MKIGRRQVILCVALIGTLVAVALVRAPDSELEVAVPARVAPADHQGDRPEPPSAESSSFFPLHRRDLPRSDKDPFRAKSWYVAPEAPSEPTAPPLPFTYIGMYQDRGKSTVYLARGDEVFPVTAGQRFADSYRLEKIGRGVLVIDYIPLKIRQTLSIGGNE